MYDTIIIGGGIGGLQAAIQLGRSLRRVLVIDQKTGRSVLAKKYRNMLGYPEGTSGEHLRKTGEQQARLFGVEFLFGQAELLSQEQDGFFRVKLKNHADTYIARTIIVSTGIEDAFPVIPGLGPCLGDSVFICPDCDGYEVVNRKTIVIGTGPQAVSMAKTLTYFTEKLVVINHGKTKLDDKSLTLLNELNVPYYVEAVASINEINGQIHNVILQSGVNLDCEKGFLAFAGAHVKTDLLQNFSVQLLQNGHIQVHPRSQETDHPGIWAVGDIVAHSQQVTIAMGDGSKAAIWIQKRLLENRSQRPLVTIE